MLNGDDGSSLLGKSLLSSVPHISIAQTAGFHLVGKMLGTGLLSLGLVDVLHEYTLVLENVALALEVELVVTARSKKSR